MFENVQRLERLNKFRRITRPRFATRKKLGIRLLFGYEYRAESGVITRLELYLNQNFKIRHIRASLNRAGICASTEHDFGFSISSFDSTWVTDF